MTRAYLQWGRAGEPMQTERADVRYNPTSADADSGYRIMVPGYGWRKLRYPELRERLAGDHSPYIILTGKLRVSVTLDHSA